MTTFVIPSVNVAIILFSRFNLILVYSRCKSEPEHCLVVDLFDLTIREMFITHRPFMPEPVESLSYVEKHVEAILCCLMLIVFLYFSTGPILLRDFLYNFDVTGSIEVVKL